MRGRENRDWLVSEPTCKGRSSSPKFLHNLRIHPRLMAFDGETHLLSDFQNVVIPQPICVHESISRQGPPLEILKAQEMNCVD